MLCVVDVRFWNLVFRSIFHLIECNSIKDDYYYYYFLLLINLILLLILCFSICLVFNTTFKSSIITNTIAPAIIPTIIATIASNETTESITTTTTTSAITTTSHLQSSSTTTGATTANSDTKLGSLSVKYDTDKQLLHSTKTMVRGDGPTISFSTTNNATTDQNCANINQNPSANTNNINNSTNKSRFTVVLVPETELSTINEEEMLIGQLKNMIPSDASTVTTNTTTTSDESETSSLSMVTILRKKQRKELKRQEQSLMAALKKQKYEDDDNDELENEQNLPQTSTTSETSDSMSCCCDENVTIGSDCHRNNELETDKNIRQDKHGTDSSCAPTETSSSSSNLPLNQNRIKIFRKHKPSLQYQEYKV